MTRSRASLGCMTAGRSEKRDIRRGAMMVGVGGWLLINSQGIGGLDYSSSWPLLLVMFGLIQTILPCKGKSRVSGLMLIAWGAIAWIATNQLGGFGWISVWPLFVVFAGIEIVWSAVRQPRARHRSNEKGGPAAATTDGINPSGTQRDGINPADRHDD